MVEFGGWEMPVQYSSIVEEHHTVRNAVGLFDISHMGRLDFKGPHAMRFLNELLTCRTDNLTDGQVRYGLVCKDTGGVLDDILVSRFSAENFGLVVNAGNRAKIVDWIKFRLKNFTFDQTDSYFAFSDFSGESAMIALQGPQALPLMNQVTGHDLSGMKYYSVRGVTLQQVPAMISRTGYTGEDGFEIIIPVSAGLSLWELLISEGQKVGLKPCGLGCRDTLRLEAAMPLYGHELSEVIDPYMAGLGFAVKTEKSQFVGKDALVKLKDQPSRMTRVGLKLQSRRIAREHTEVFLQDERVGEVSSGTYSPTLEQSIAMAFVSPTASAVGTMLEVDIRGKREVAEVVPLPFYKRA